MTREHVQHDITQDLCGECGHTRKEHWIPEEERTGHCQLHGCDCIQFLATPITVTMGLPGATKEGT